MNLVLGTMNIEYKYTSNTDNTITHYENIINEYIHNVDNPILDTAYYYGNTKTEQILGEILMNKKVKIATKANPWFNNDFTNGILGQLSPDNIERQLYTSLKNLKKDNVDIFYLHSPDHETPINDTLIKCEELWRKEKFNIFGLSNYSKNQVDEIINLSENLSIKPKIYQGMYNLISRKVEEIFPLLDDNNIEFWAYNPLAGGLLTGKYINDINENCRFKNNEIYQNIFWKNEIIENMKDFNKLSNKIEYSYLWLKNYSKLRDNDKIIIGISTINQLKYNLQVFNENKLITNDVLQILNNIHNSDHSPNYYY
jgi:aflatoxin B1 aldehyde reductase